MLGQNEKDTSERTKTPNWARRVSGGILITMLGSRLLAAADLERPIQSYESLRYFIDKSGVTDESTIRQLGLEINGYNPMKVKVEPDPTAVSQRVTYSVSNEGYKSFRVVTFENGEKKDEDVNAFPTVSMADSASVYEVLNFQPEEQRTELFTRTLNKYMEEHGVAGTITFEDPILTLSIIHDSQAQNIDPFVGIMLHEKNNPDGYEISLFPPILDGSLLDPSYGLQIYKGDEHLVTFREPYSDYYMQNLELTMKDLIHK